MKGASSRPEHEGGLDARRRRRGAARVIDTILLGRIASVDNGLARVMVGTQEVRAAAPAEAGHEAALCIRAEDVTIALHDSTTQHHQPMAAVVRTEASEGPFGASAWIAASVCPRSSRGTHGSDRAGAGATAWAMVKATTIQALLCN